MKFKIVGLVLLLLVLFGCTQVQTEQKDGDTELENPYVQPLEPPKVNLENFEFEFTTIENTGMVTLLFQKDNITKTTQRHDNDVLEMKSKEISQKEFEELAKTIYANISALDKEEYGYFEAGSNGPTYIMEAKFDGTQKVVSCQLNCPKEIVEIKEKIEPFLEKE